MSDYLLSSIPENIQNKVLTAIVAETINLVYLHPVTFGLIWRDITTDVITKIQDRLVEKKSRYGKSIYDVPDHLNWFTLLLPVRRATIRSKQIGNPNNSQSCVQFSVPVHDFEWHIECKEGLSIRHITEAIYRLKSSKYDYIGETIRLIETEEVGEDCLQFHVYFKYQSSHPG